MALVRMQRLDHWPGQKFHRVGQKRIVFKKCQGVTDFFKQSESGFCRPYCRAANIIDAFKNTTYTGFLSLKNKKRTKNSFLGIRLRALSVQFTVYPPGGGDVTWPGRWAIHVVWRRPHLVAVRQS